MRRVVLLLCLAVPVAAPASPIAEIVCAPREEMEARLARQYGETRRGVGVRDHEAVMEIWTSERGSWTLVMSWAQGHSCIVAMGEAWSDLPPDPA